MQCLRSAVLSVTRRCHAPRPSKSLADGANERPSSRVVLSVMHGKPDKYETKTWEDNEGDEAMDETLLRSGRSNRVDVIRYFVKS